MTIIILHQFILVHDTAQCFAYLHESGETDKSFKRQGAGKGLASTNLNTVFGGEKSKEDLSQSLQNFTTLVKMT